MRDRRVLVFDSYFFRVHARMRVRRTHARTTRRPAFLLRKAVFLLSGPGGVGDFRRLWLNTVGVKHEVTGFPCAMPTIYITELPSPRHVITPETPDETRHIFPTDPTSPSPSISVSVISSVMTQQQRHKQ